jgi:diguanylate cyclase (GGDEF)-like protein
MRRLRAGARGLFALASVWFLISLAHVPLWADGRFEHHAPEAPALATVRTIHHLSVEEAARSYPVHVTGVVTALSGFGRSFFVQDATGGITVDRTDELDVHVGDRVDIVGVTSAGYFAPTIISSKVVILGSAPPPPAPPMTYADLVGGAQDSQWVEVHGVVHSARMGKIFDKDTLILGLDVGGTLVKVLLQDYAGIDYPHLIDATVRVRGVATTEFNDRRQFLGVNLFVPLRKDFDLVQPAGADPFAGPALRVRNAFQFGQAAHRVKVAGAVTWQLPGHSIYIQDGEDGIQIETASTDVLALGTPIEVVGFPAMGEYSPVLKGAIFRVTGPPVPVKPLSISAADVISRDSYFNRAKHDGQLVEIKGKVIESHFEGTVRTLILGEDGQVFEAILADPGGRPKDGLANGSIVRLEGICAVVADAEHTPISFRILLRSPHDMALLQTAPWWSSTHALWVLGLLSGAMVMVVLWGMILRTRVESQTKTIRESEERFRDLAQRDVLTGLPNRLLLEERIAACLLRCKESRGKAAVLTIDIDRFKHINDTYGHAAGDECLRVVASRLRNATPETDTIARTGGEEFTLVAAGLKDHEDMERITNRVLDLFRDPVVLGELEIGVTVSVGCAIYPDDGVERAELLKRSDQALYEAKRTGRNRVVFATDELSAQFDRASTIELAVRESLRAGTFTLVYQPVYDAAGTIHRLEALLRTSDELLSALGPAV